MRSGGMRSGGLICCTCCTLSSVQTVQLNTVPLSLSTPPLICPFQSHVKAEAGSKLQQSQTGTGMAAMRIRMTPYFMFPPFPFNSAGL